MHMKRERIGPSLWQLYDETIPTNQANGISDNFQATEIVKINVHVPAIAGRVEIFYDERSVASFEFNVRVEYQNIPTSLELRPGDHTIRVEFIGPEGLAIVGVQSVSTGQPPDPSHN